jgi:membrane associated rhomboid family serine protease
MTAPEQQSGTGDGDAPDASAPHGSAPPACYRHPGRESYVSCVRCGRHACPDCLRSAAVGQQCVDCVREGHQDSRPARAVFGGTPSRTAIVTWSLLAVNVILYLVELAKPSLADSWSLLGYASPSGLPPYQGIASGQWYRLITSAFLPPTGTTGLFDIAFNMWALFVVGPSLERLLGWLRYLSVYVLSAIGGGVAYYLVVPPNQSALGASGAIFGLFAAWFVVARRLRLNTGGIVTIIVINLVFSFVYHSSIAWQAHIGGLITGGLITAAYAYAPRKQRTATQVVATVVILAILGAIAAYRTGQIHAMVV